MTFYIMVGASGSGKSTLVQNIVRNLGADNCIVVCPDDIRAEFAKVANPALSQHEAENDQTQNVAVFSEAASRISRYTREGTNVIFDATNPNRKARKFPLEVARKAGATRAIAYYISTPIEVCKTRNAARPRRVPDEVIDKQFARLSVPTRDEGFDEVYVLDENGYAVSP